jgi:hypothetical protein
MKDIKSTQAENEISKLPTNARRQFFKKAAIGSALLTTVSSRPVWATAVGCTVSGQMSGNLSNPDWDECGSPATGKSPGWWKLWNDIFRFFRFAYDPATPFDDYKQNIQNIFKIDSDGSPITVLYNWIIASNNSGVPQRIPYPAINGSKTPIGKILSGKGNDPEYNYAAALLSAAHPDIHFPYPDNQWTLSYLIANFNDGKTKAETINLADSFFDNHIEPPIRRFPGATIGTTNYPATPEGALNWAKAILGF